jgi:hypothetical protein
MCLFLGSARVLSTAGTLSGGKARTPPVNNRPLEEAPGDEAFGRIAGSERALT